MIEPENCDHPSFFLVTANYKICDLCNARFLKLESEWKIAPKLFQGKPEQKEIKPK